MSKKRGQAWGFDLIIGAVVFVVGVLGFYFFSINSQQEQSNKLQELNYAATSIADNILSEGLPSNWNQTKVIRIGITNNNKINQTKLDMFYNLSVTNYALTKSIFNTNKEYYVVFKTTVYINNQSITSIGKTPQNQKNLIKQTRLSVYRNKPITLEVYAWD
jgi:hypothetical protein